MANRTVRRLAVLATARLHAGQNHVGCCRRCAINKLSGRYKLNLCMKNGAGRGETSPDRLVHTPPLRSEDIVLLAKAFLRRDAQSLRHKIRFSAEALEALTKYARPGNIRGLENKVHRAVIMASGRVIEPADLELNGSGSVGAQSSQGSSRQEDQRLVDELKRAAQVAD